MTPEPRGCSAAVKTDIDLQREILESIIEVVGRDVVRIGVVAQDNVVVLSGFASSLTAKWLAEYIALSIYGVRTITNWIEIWRPRREHERAAGTKET
jgi:osmotically-inducible protein OsmY